MHKYSGRWYVFLGVVRVRAERVVSTGLVCIEDRRYKS